MQLPGTRFCGFSTAQALYAHDLSMNGTVKPLKIFIPEPVFVKHMAVAIIVRSYQANH